MSTEENKNIVRRFNEEFISQGNMDAFTELLAPDVVDHTALRGFPPGAEGVKQLFFGLYRAAFPDLRAEIYDLVAEGDKVVTRKAFHGTHLGSLMGIPPTGKQVTINVIDIVRVVNGKIAEQWLQERGRCTDGAQQLPQEQSYATLGAATSQIH
jgi:predicted ester cyclase